VTHRAAARSGFTLVEVMISSALATVVMAAVLSTFVFMGRNLARLASYQSLETESRKALAYLRRDFAVAQSIKNGTTPTTSSVTLVLPAGEVTYTYDSTTRDLRRLATFGPNPDFTLLRNTSCECTTFAFRYFTTTDGAPTDQATSSVNVPFSIKQIQVRFVVESPASWSAQTRTRYEAASSRFLFRNRGATDGT
jgi:prepilin-type N-terminal cleavage/methylation domain-containing protein